MDGQEREKEEGKAGKRKEGKRNEWTWRIMAIVGTIIAVVFMIAFPVWAKARSTIGDWAKGAGEITSHLIGRAIEKTASTSVETDQEPLPGEGTQEPLPGEGTQEPLPGEETQEPLPGEETQEPLPGEGTQEPPQGEETQKPLGQKDQELLTQREAVIYYIFISVIVVTIIITVLRGLYVYFADGGKGSKNQEALVEQYLPSMSVLLISAAALFIVSGGRLFELKNISKAWEALLIIILFFLVVLTAFEVVRIALEQCFNARSILKNLIRLLFLAILNFLSSILLGIISNMHIQSIISSLLFLVFADDEDSMVVPITRVLRGLFAKEISEIKGSAGRKEAKFEKFDERRIWER